jgi:separase
VFEKNFNKNYEVEDENITRIDQSKNLVEVLREKVIKIIFCLTSKSWSIGKHYYLSPWKVMQSYLECTHQIGIVNEAIGNESDAMYYFNKVKSLAHEFDLPIFIVTFSLLLGMVTVFIL